MTYSSTVLADSPTIYWRLGETGARGASATITDSSGNSNTTGAQMAGVGWGVTGPHTGVTAAQFYGAGTGVTGIAPATPATLSGSYTVEFVVKNGTTGEIFGTRAPSDFGFDIALTSTAINADVGNGTSWIATGANATVTWPATAWWHVAYVVTATGWTAYANGTQVGTGAFTGTPLLWDASHKVAIGGNGTTFTPATGTIGEVAVYASALSATRISAHAAAVGNATSYASAVTADAPSAWWRLQDDSAGATDSSGGGVPPVYDGTSTAATGLLTSDSNGATTFNGSTGYATARTTTTFANSFSVEAWIKTTSTTGGVIAAVGNSPPGQTSTSGETLNSVLAMTSTGQITFDTAPNPFSGTVFEIKSAAAFNDGVSHHVVATYLVGTGAVLYVDGQLVTSDTAHTGALLLAGNAEYWRVGYSALTSSFPINAAVTSAFFSGTIDEVAVYPSALSAAKVSTHYLAGKATLGAYNSAVLADSPTLFWRLGTPQAFTDSSGNSNTSGATFSGVGWAASGPHTGVTAAQFFGAGSGIASVAPATPATLSGSFTVELIAKNGTTGEVFGTRAPSDFGFDLFLGANGSGQNLHADIGTGTGWLVTNANASFTWPATAWWHIAVVVTTTSWTQYVNGTQVATGTFAGTPLLWDTSHKVQIGSNGVSTDTKSNGTLAEVAVYNTALSSTRISAHASAVGTASSYSSAVTADTPVAWWRLADNSGVTDTSGNGVTPAYTGPLPSATGLISGDADTALTFDAASSYVSAGVASTLVDTFSIEAWFKTSSTAGGVLVEDVNRVPGDTTVASSAFNRILAMKSGGQLVLDLNDSGGTRHELATTAAYNDGLRHHVVAVHQAGTGGGTWIYVDGQLRASDALTYAVEGTATTRYWRAGWGFTATFAIDGELSNRFWNGVLDEVAVYGQALSPARVSVHYLTGLATLTSYDSTVLADSPAFYWKLNETSGTTASDASGNARNGTIAGTPTYGVTGLTNDAGSALTFPTGSFITTALDSGQQTSSRTVELWARAGSNVSPTSLGTPLGMFTSDGVGSGLLVGQINTASDVWYRRTTTSANRDPHISLNGLSGAGMLFDGKIHHIVQTYDGSTIVVYIDGSQVASLAAAGPLSWGDTRGGFMLNGYSSDGTTRFTLSGWTYDNVAAYPTALSSTRVSAHYTAGAPTTNPGRTGSTTYQTTVLADNPLLLWPLNETSGSTFTDASGNGRNGAVDGTAAGVSYSQPGLTADGGTSVTLANTVAIQLATVDPGMTTTDALSYELWTKEGSTTTDGLAMLASGGIHGGLLFGQLTTSTNMEFRVALGAGVFSSGVNLTPATYFGDGLRHHVVQTYDGATLKVYIDGALAGSTAVTGAIDYSSISSGLLLNDYFDSSTAHLLNGWGFDNFAVYGTALSASRVSAHFSAGNSPFGGTIVPSFVGSAAASQMQPLAGTIAPSLTGTAAAMVGLALSGTVQPLASWLVSTTLRNVIGGTINSPLIGLVTLGNSVNAIVAPDLSGLPVLPLPVDPNAPRAFRLNGTDLPPASLISYPVGNSRTWFARQSLLLVWRGLSVSAANMLLAYATATPATVDILMPSFRWNANVPVRLVTAGQADPAVLGLAGPGQGTLGVPANPPGMYNGVVVARLELLADIPILPPLVS